MACGFESTLFGAADPDVRIWARPRHAPYESHTRAIGEGLFEIRAKAGVGIGRAFYCTLVGKRIVVLHGFIKKTDKTPPREIKIARERLKELKP